MLHLVCMSSVTTLKLRIRRLWVWSLDGFRYKGRKKLFDRVAADMLRRSWRVMLIAICLVVFGVSVPLHWAASGVR